MHKNQLKKLKKSRMKHWGPSGLGQTREDSPHGPMTHCQSWFSLFPLQVLQSRLPPHSDCSAILNQFYLVKICCHHFGSCPFLTFLFSQRNQFIVNFSHMLMQQWTILTHSNSANCLSHDTLPLSAGTTCFSSDATA